MTLNHSAEFVVTESTDFIGRSVVSQLVDQGVKPLCLIRGEPKGWILELRVADKVTISIPRYWQSM